MSEKSDVNISRIDVSTPDPPDNYGALVGLSLLQTGKGHRIGYYHARWSDDHVYDESMESEVEIDEESDNGCESGLEIEEETEDATETPWHLHLCHSIHFLRTYVYAQMLRKSMIGIQRTLWMSGLRRGILRGLWVLSLRRRRRSWLTIQTRC
jgi:hypothetical protein